MLALKIILGILLAIVLVLLIRVKISVVSSKNEVKLLLRILGIPIRLYPGKEKKEKVDLKDYTPRALRRDEKKRAKKARREALKKKSKPEEDEGTEEKPPLSETVSVITELVRVITSKFLKHLRVDLTKISISVGASDAAKTGILYGAVCQGVAYLTELLDKITNVKRNRRTEISVKADFLSGKTVADIDLSFSLTVWQALDILLGAAMQYIKRKSK